MSRSRPVVDGARRMRIANMIRQARLAAHLDQAQLAEELGVTPGAVGNWERCIARPDIDTIPRLCSILHLSVTDLLGLEPELTLTGDERDVVRLYRELNPFHQKTVLALLRQLEQNETDQRQEELRRSARPMRAVLGAAAGFGGPLDGEAPLERRYVRNNPYAAASTMIVRVNGQSMEPVYPDGSFVYIDEHREPRIGDDVVVVYEGTLYIKTFTTAGLVSYNTNKKRYPTIKVDGWQNVKCLGVVTGRVGDYDILSGQELRDVERAYAAIEE